MSSEEEWSPGHQRVGLQGFLKNPQRALSYVDKGVSVVLAQGHVPTAVLRPVTDEEREYYRVQAERIERLRLLSKEVLDRLNGRLSPQSVEHCQTLHYVGEWHLCVDLLAAHFLNNRISVTHEERELIQELLNIFPNPDPDLPFIERRDEVIAALNVVDH